MSGEVAWTVGTLLRWTTDFFGQRGIETARLDAEILLASALESDRLRLYLDFEKPVTLQERESFRSLVKKRADDRIPVAQLVGQKEFWSLNLLVTQKVLTPRPDTETLVQQALEKLPDPEAEYRIVDVGTGSGAIAIALASERKKSKIWATDISAEALEVAAQNVEKHGLEERVALCQGSLYDAVAGLEFDLIVSNPPYLAEGLGAPAAAAELRHEPKQALFAGDDGLDVLRPLLANADSYLRPGGWLLLEIAPEQEESAGNIAQQAGLCEIQFANDLAGCVRVLLARVGGN